MQVSTAFGPYQPYGINDCASAAKGVLTPGALSTAAELKAIARAVDEGGGGVFEMSSDFSSYDDVPYDQMDQKKRREYQLGEAQWLFGMCSATVLLVPVKSRYRSLFWMGRTTCDEEKTLIMSHTPQSSLHTNRASDNLKPMVSHVYASGRDLARSSDSESLRGFAEVVSVG